MAVAFETDSILARTTRTNSTITAPTGITDGDVLVICFEIGILGAAPTPTPPAGFAIAPGGTYPMNQTDGSFNNNTYVWSKVASGEAGNYTVTHSSAITGAYMFRASGATGVTTSTTNTGSGNPSTANSLNVDVDGSMVVFLANYWDPGALSPPSGTTPTFTERYNPVADSAMYVATGIFSGTGATGNKTQTPPGSPWSAALVLLEAEVVEQTIAPDSIVVEVTFGEPTVANQSALSIIPDSIDVKVRFGAIVIANEGAGGDGGVGSRFDDWY